MKAHGLISAGLALTLTLAASPAVQAADTTAGHYAATASLTLTPGETDQVNLGRPVESVTPKAGPASYHWENITVDKETGKVSITAPAEPADHTGTGTAEYGEYTFDVVYADGETGTFTILFQAVAAEPEDPTGEDGDNGDGGESGDGEGEVEDDNNDDVEEKETEPGDGDDDSDEPGEDGDDDSDEPGEDGDDDSDEPGEDGDDDSDEPGEDGDDDSDEPGEDGDDPADPTDDERTDDKPAEESTDKNPLPQTSSSSSDLSSFGSFLKTILSFLTRLFT